MIPIRVPCFTALDSTSADGRVMEGRGWDFSLPPISFIGGIFCLQFDRGEAKGLRRTHRRLYCSPVVDNF